MSLIGGIKANKNSAGSGTDMIGSAIADGVGQIVSIGGAVSDNVKDINMSAQEKMDDRGNITHNANVGGKTLDMGLKGMELGGTIGGPIGAGIGAIAGAQAGLVMGLMDKAPDQNDMIDAEERYQLGLQMKTIGAENTFAKQQLMAKDGMNVGESKQIEVEKDEIVLRKIGNSYKKVADFKGGKSHIQGGEQYVAAEGDVIFPGKDRGKVTRALKHRRWRAIESMRMQLPMDKGQDEFKKGTSSIAATKVKPPKKVLDTINKFLADPKVKSKVIEIAKKNGFTPERLVELIYFETGGSMSPNQKAGNSNGMGLIQFMPNTAKDLGTTTEKLSKMDTIEQLGYVGKYFDKNHTKGEDPYVTVASPSASKKGLDDTVYKKGSQAYKSNSSWVGKDGRITKQSIIDAVPSYDGFTIDDPTNEVNSFDNIAKTYEGSGVQSSQQSAGTAIGDTVATMSDEDFNKKMSEDTKFRGMWNVSDKEAEQARLSSDIGGIVAETSMSAIPGTGPAVGWLAQKFDLVPRLNNAVEIGKSWANGDMGITDKTINTNEVGYYDNQLYGKLENFIQYLQGDAKGKSSGLNVTSSMMDGLREYTKWQSAVTAGQDVNGSLPNIIAEIFAGEDPKTINKWVNKAVSDGVLDRKTEWIVNDAAKNPENVWTGKMATNLGVDVATILANPKGIINAVKSGGKILKLGGKAAGITIPKLFKTLKGLKGSKAVLKKLATTIKDGVVGSVKYSESTTLDDIVKLGKKLDDAGVPKVGENISKTKSWSESLSDTWKTIEKLPKKVREAYSGTSMDKLSAAKNSLLEVTGKTSDELLGMSNAEVGRLLQTKLDGVASTITKAGEARLTAANKFKDASKTVTKAKKSLAELRAQRGPKDVIGKAEKSLARAEDALSSSKSELTQAYSNEKLVDKTWNEVGRIEKFMDSKEYNSNYHIIKTLKKDYDNAVKALDGMEGVPEQVKQASKNFSKWSSKVSERIIRAENAKDISKGVIKAEDILTDANISKSTAKSALNTAVNAEDLAISKGVELNKILNKTPEWLRLVEKDAAVMNGLKNGTITAAKFANILRDRGGDKIDLGPLDTMIKEEEKSVLQGSDNTKRDDINKRSEAMQKIGADSKIGIQPVDGGGVDKTLQTTTKTQEPEKIGGKFDTSIVGGAFKSLASYAPAIYNITKGLERPDKIKRQFVAPQTRKYENMSQPQINVINNAFEAAVGNARNTSGGVMSNFRSNIERAWADKIQRRAEVNMVETGRADKIAAENINTLNNAEQYNKQVAGKADIFDMQSEAATNSFLAQGMQDVANIASRNKKDKMAENNQNTVLGLINSGRFKYDPATGKFELNKSSNTARTTATPNAVNSTVNVEPIGVKLGGNNKSVLTTPNNIISTTDAVDPFSNFEASQQEVNLGTVPKNAGSTDETKIMDEYYNNQ